MEQKLQAKQQNKTDLEKKQKPSAQAVVDRPLFVEHLQKGLAKTGLALQPEQLGKLTDYYERLVEANRVMNLTGITAADEVAEKHIIDCLMAAKYIGAEKKVADIGSGAGLPGIPLAIVKPEAAFVLMDSLQKRCRFLQKTVEALGLPNVSIVWGRAEEMGRQKEHREQYGVVLSRAVAALPVLLEYMLPLLKTKGIAAAMKSIKVSEEAAEAAFALQELQGKIVAVEHYTLETGEKRSILVVEKTKACTDKYPRTAGAIKKNPLVTRGRQTWDR